MLLSFNSDSAQNGCSIQENTSISYDHSMPYFNRHGGHCGGREVKEFKDLKTFLRSS